MWMHAHIYSLKLGPGLVLLAEVCPCAGLKFGEFVTFILFLKTHFEGGLALFRQTIGSLLIPLTLGSEAGWENDLRMTPIDSTISKIRPTLDKVTLWSTISNGREDRSCLG
jgi:hypothetical protein